MHPHADLLNRFYGAFSARDPDGMAACYHPDAEFSDPVFPDLSGDRLRGMWRMLCERGEDLTLEHSAVTATDDVGSVHWEARYTFITTGRKVHNIVEAEFRFRDGLILEHRDRFSFYRWSRQALGPAGTLLGWTPLVLNKVRSTAGGQLERFLARTEPRA